MRDRVGKIEVVTGCMFSGKSEELIRRLKRAKIAKLNVQVFKPSLDTRVSSIEVVSHTGEMIQAEPVASSSELYKAIKTDADVIGVDEVQFFDDGIFDVARQISKDGKRIIFAGLDMDFRGEPFGRMPSLMAIADEVLKLHAICMVCGEDATMTQRLIDGHAAKYSDPIVLIGAEERYEARCKLHHYIEREE